MVTHRPHKPEISGSSPDLRNHRDVFSKSTTCSEFSSAGWAIVCQTIGRWFEPNNLQSISVSYMGGWHTRSVCRTENPRTVVRLHLLPPIAEKQHPLHKMHGDVWCNTAGLVSVWYYGRIPRVLCYPQANKEKHIIPQEDCEWNENPFPYISETYGTKNYIYEKFFTPVNRLLFSLIVFNILWRGTQVVKGAVC